MLLHEKIRDAYVHPQFIADVIKPLQIEQIMDQEVCREGSTLGGGGREVLALSLSNFLYLVARCLDHVIGSN